jgi:hypothetical protein
VQDRVAPFVALLGPLVGAIGVGQALPLAQGRAQVVVAQGGGEPDEDRIGSFEVVCDPRVGRDPREDPHVGDGDVAGEVGGLDQREVSQGAGGLDPAVGLGARQPPDGLQRSLGGLVPIEGEGRRAVEVPGGVVGAGVEAPAQMFEPADQRQLLARGQLVQRGRAELVDRHLERIECGVQLRTGRGHGHDGTPAWMPGEQGRRNTVRPPSQPKRRSARSRRVAHPTQPGRLGAIQPKGV